MDKLIQDLFKKNDEDYVTLTNHYLEKISQNVRARGGKMVTGREMNEIYQEGGYYHYLGTEHVTTPDSGINDTRTPVFVIQTRDAPGTFGFGNDSGASIPQAIKEDTATGDSPTLSYGVNNTPCAGTTTDYNSQCASTSSCTVSYKVNEQPKSIFSKIWGYIDDTTVSNNNKNVANTVTRPCAPTQTGGGKPKKKISNKDFNKLIDNAEFKMPKYQQIQFKSFIEHLINQ